jgi:CheY-like chemotaxis protein
MPNVLLIEPDVALATTYAAALRHAGYAVSCSRGAQDAIEAADQAVPDVIILELQLTAHDGIEFLHELRSYPEWQAIPVVVNTTIAPQALAPVQEAMQRELGVRACHYKPRTSLQQLIRSVNEQAGTVPS